jgi:signal transduction histidine kinase
LKLCEINKIINDVIKLISKETLPDNIKLDVNLKDVPFLMLDNEQMEQAIINIIINSIQAMPQGGKLGISSSFDANSEFVELKIYDTGYGIESQDMDKIFEPFFTKRHKGTGLGLAICARIIEDHKGFIEVNSISGKGTKFIVKLPTAKSITKDAGDK